MRAARHKLALLAQKYLTQKALNAFCVSIILTQKALSAWQGWQPNDSSELALRESADHNHCCVVRCLPKPLFSLY